MHFARISTRNKKHSNFIFYLISNLNKNLKFLFLFMLEIPIVTSVAIHGNACCLVLRIAGDGFSPLFALVGPSAAITTETCWEKIYFLFDVKQN